MDIYYAVGAGLGHVNRAGVFLRKLSLNNVVIVTNNANAIGLLEGFKYEVLPNNTTQNVVDAQKKLIELLDFYKPKKVYLDTFPGGIHGEWCELEYPSIKFYLVSRILKVDAYLKDIGYSSFPVFEEIFLCETVSQEQLDFLSRISKDKIIHQINLEFRLRPSKKASIKNQNDQEPYWIIIHSGNLDECLALFQQANDLANLHNKIPRLIFIHPNPTNLKGKLKHSVVVQDFGLLEYVERAEKVFTACGFNLMHELVRYKAKHEYLPFYRKYDDQFLRAKIFKQKIG